MGTVTCDQLRATFRSGQVPSGPEVSAHLEVCPDCALICEDEAVAGRALGRLQPAQPVDLSRLRDGLRHKLDAERGVRAWLRSRKTSTRVSLALVVALALIAVASRRSHSVSTTEAGGGVPALPQAAACFSYGSLFTALFLVLLWALSRRDGASIRTAALAGLGSAAVGVLGLSAHCPSFEPLHLLAGHASIVLAWVVACVIVAWAAPLRRGSR